MKKNIILMFGFLLFTQSNIFAMDCCAKEDGHAEHSASEHKDMKMAKKDVTDTASIKVENAGNTICPVTGEKIVEKYKSTYEYKGKIYNFCCNACVDEFKKDPEKSIKKVEEELNKKGEKMNMKVKDPVCNMEFNSDKADATSVYNGKTYYFCSKDCKTKFEKEPKNILRNNKITNAIISGLGNPAL